MLKASISVYLQLETNKFDLGWVGNTLYWLDYAGLCHPAL